jgi:hypothetical protein
VNCVADCGRVLEGVELQVPTANILREGVEKREKDKRKE